MTTKTDLPLWATRPELRKLVGVDANTIRRWVRKGFIVPDAILSRTKQVFYLPSTIFDIEKNCLPLGPIARDLRAAYIQAGYLHEARNAKTLDETYRG